MINLQPKHSLKLADDQYIGILKNKTKDFGSLKQILKDEKD
jgi:hypothetical protein